MPYLDPFNAVFLCSCYFMVSYFPLTLLLVFLCFYYSCRISISYFNHFSVVSYFCISWRVIVSFSCSFTVIFYPSIKAEGLLFLASIVSSVVSYACISCSVIVYFSDLLIVESVINSNHLFFFLSLLLLYHVYTTRVPVSLLICLTTNIFLKIMVFI